MSALGTTTTGHRFINTIYGIGADGGQYENIFIPEYSLEITQDGRANEQTLLIGSIAQSKAMDDAIQSGRWQKLFDQAMAHHRRTHPSCTGECSLQISRQIEVEITADARKQDMQSNVQVPRETAIKIQELMKRRNALEAEVTSLQQEIKQHIADTGLFPKIQEEEVVVVSDELNTHI